jgi:hypothetical protein
MARSASVWHADSRYPRASFPNNVCVRFTTAGENVGESSSGVEGQDLEILNAMIMKEPHSASVCAVTINHACNVVNPAFHRVGIGIYYSAGSTWLTEDFTN